MALVQHQFYDQDIQLGTLGQLLLQYVTAGMTSGLTGIQAAMARAAISGGVQGVVSGNFDIGAILTDVVFAGVSSYATSAFNLNEIMGVANGPSLLGVANGQFSLANITNSLGDSLISAGLTTAVYGGDFGAAFLSSFQSSLSMTALADMQRGIGDFVTANGIAEGSGQHVILHALAGCVGAAAAGGDCAAGAAAGIGQSLYAGTLDGTTLSDEAQQRNAQLLGGIAAAFASGGDAAATMLASNIALSGMANNRQLHRDEVEWLRNNAQDFADQMGISYEEALAILIAAGTSLTDANPQIGGVDLDMLSTAAEWISDNAPVGMVVSGASGQEFFQSRDEVEYNNTFINVSDYFESGAHEALVAGGIVTRDSPLFDVMQASADSRAQNSDVRELIDIYYGGDTAAYFEDMTYGIAATVTSGVYNDPNFALATWSAAISDAQQAGVAIPPETMAYIRAASFATALGAGGLDRAGTSLIFDNLLRTMGIAPTPGLLTPSGGRRDTADEPIDIGGGGPGSGILPSPTTFNDLVSSSNLSGQTGSTRNFERSGGFAQANADFDALNPTNVRTISVSSGGTGRVGTLPDGRTVIVRETSQGANGQSGPPIVEVQGGTSGGLNARSKIRY